MQFVVTGRLEGILDQETREPLAESVVCFYPGDTQVVAPGLLVPPQAPLPADGLLAEGPIDASGGFRVILGGGYSGGPLKVALKVGSLPPRSARLEPAVQCVLAVFDPVWAQDADGLRTEWHYALAAPLWRQIRAAAGAYVIIGILAGRDGQSPITGARVRAFDADLIQDDSLGSDVTDGEGRFVIHYDRGAFQRTPVPFLSFEQGTADVYFTADRNGHRILAEPRQSGGGRERRDVGAVFTARLRTDAPSVVITVDTPVDGRVTNQPLQQVTGYLSEPAELTLDRRPIPVGADLRFAAEVTLAEGDNLLSLIAVSTATGVRCMRRVRVTVDSTAPAAPDPSRITVTPSGGETSIVEGATGCTEPGVMVEASGIGGRARTAALGDGSFRLTIAAARGESLQLTATDAAGNASAVVGVEVAGAEVPDPTEVAPALPTTQPSSLGSATEFLYSGPDPIQTGLFVSIEPQRVAVLRGKVIDADLHPLSAVCISVVGRPEFGRTLSRADGCFDLVVNGGGDLVVGFDKTGFLTAHRHLSVPWQDYLHVPDVVLRRLDTLVTAVTTEAAISQVARGSRIQDPSGGRQATLIIPSGTSAAMVMPDGTELPLTVMHMRATEYTVGDQGAAAMPAVLPPSSGYTYAVDFSVDEAIEAGAVGVRFSQPVTAYVENFLGFPAGSDVPAGSYDVSTAQWIPLDNGRIVTIVAVHAGTAEIDITGDGVADPPDVLAALGITHDERLRLAEMYPPGQQLWRVPLEHLSPCDLNWPIGLPPDAIPPNPRRPPFAPSESDPCAQPGASAIVINDQVLLERLPVTGTPYTLCYSSERVLGRTAELTIPISGTEVPASLRRIELSIQVAGRSHHLTFPPSPNQEYRFVWDRQDAYGRHVPGVQPITIEIGFVYGGVYRRPGEFGRAFAAFGSADTAVIGDRAREEITLRRTLQAAIGGWLTPLADGLGGWSLDIHHVWSPSEQTLYLGDGTRRGASAFGAVISTVAYYASVLGQRLMSNDHINGASALLVEPDGSLLAIDHDAWGPEGGHRVLRIGFEPSPFIRTVAGGGHDPDGSRGDQISLNDPRDIALGPDGSLYIAEAHRVLKVDPNGIASTVAGGVPGEYDAVIDGGPADETPVFPRSVAVASDGTVYVADKFTRIRRIGLDGIITTVVGDGEAGYTPDGNPASGGRVGEVKKVAIGPDGDLHFTERIRDDVAGFTTDELHVRKIGPDGVLTTVVRRSGYYTTFSSYEEDVMTIGADGSVYTILEKPGRRRFLERTAPDGSSVFVNGHPEKELIWREGAAAASAPCDAKGIALALDGSLYLSSRSQSIHRIGSWLPGGTTADVLIPSRDGHEFYAFDPTGRHLMTVDTLTGAVLRRFVYDDQGRLSAVVEGPETEHNTTMIERGPDGCVLRFVSADTTITGVSIDADGWLTSVIDPDGTANTLTYSSGGLLTELSGPRGLTRFTYDERGRLTRDSDPQGNTIAVAVTGDLTGTTAVRLSPMLREVRLQVERRTDDTRIRRILCCGGTVTTEEQAPDGTRTITSPDGTVRILRYEPDPIWGMQAPLLADLTVTTPGGRRLHRQSQRQIDRTAADHMLGLQSLTDTITIDDRTTTVTWDSSSRTLSTTSPAGRTAMVIFDEVGRPVRLQPLAGHDTGFTYDDRGRLIRIERGARAIVFGYDPAGRLVTRTDGSNAPAEYEFDLLGRLIGRRTPTGAVHRLERDDTGTVTAVIMPTGARHALEHDHRGITISYTSPGSTAALRRAFDADGLLTGTTLPSGRTIDRAWDAAGELTEIHDPDAHTELAWRAGDSGFVLAQALHHQPQAVLQRSSFTYDADQLTSVTFDGPVTGDYRYRYKGADLAGITLDGQAEQPVEYDPDGLLTRHGPLTFRRNGAGTVDLITDGTMQVTFDHDDAGRTTSRIYSIAEKELFRIDLTFDDLDRISTLSQTLSGTTATWIYTYDPDGQLTNVRLNGQLTERYTYDANGNRTSRTLGTLPPENAEFDAQDRLTSLAGEPCGTDIDGFLTAYDGRTYHYSARGDLLSVAGPSITTTYLHDGLGRRIARLTPDSHTHYLYGEPNDHLRVTATRTSGSLTTYLYDHTGRLLRMDGPDGTSYVATDHLGTPRAVFDSTGTLIRALTYDAFGVILDDTAPGHVLPVGFAGGISDPHIPFLRFGARDYDPRSGRWTSRDPALFGSRRPNLFAYANNDPVNAADRTGTFSLKVSGYDVVGAGVKLNMTPEGFSWCVEAGFGLGGSSSLSWETDPATDLDPEGLSLFGEIGVDVLGLGSAKLKGTITTPCGFGPVPPEADYATKVQSQVCVGSVCTRVEDPADIQIKKPKFKPEIKAVAKAGVQACGRTSF